MERFFYEKIALNVRIQTNYKKFKCFYLAVLLPSTQYHLQISNLSICNLSLKKSLVTAIDIGSTEISLIDSC